MTNIKKILIVEDNIDINSILYELLSGEGYSCTQVFDGLEAVECLKKEEFDLLVTDFKMPHMNGLQLLKWCRENQIHFPVIFITANTNLVSQESIALQDCCASVIRKPMDVDVLLDAVIAASKRRHTADCE